MVTATPAKSAAQKTTLLHSLDLEDQDETLEALVDQWAQCKCDKHMQHVLAAISVCLDTFEIKQLAAMLGSVPPAEQTVLFSGMSLQVRQQVTC